MATKSKMQLLTERVDALEASNSMLGLSVTSLYMHISGVKEIDVEAFKAKLHDALAGSDNTEIF